MAVDTHLIVSISSRPLLNASNVHVLLGQANNPRLLSLTKKAG